MRIFLKAVVYCVAALLFIACTTSGEPIVKIYKQVD